MFDKIKMIFISIMISTMVVGCGISKSVQYEHKPSESFYKNFEMKDEKIKNFTEDGILITIYFQ
uniref:hypothetical protein n=1 Tax=uncultured Psychrobacter sp. TaxID=259303 RepID=UPI0025917DA1|nr:hypothetical protein [uncultured Psychrobacter sp.]